MIFVKKGEQILGGTKFWLGILKSFLFLWAICDGLAGDTDWSLAGIMFFWFSCTELWFLKSNQVLLYFLVDINISIVFQLVLI